MNKKNIHINFRIAIALLFSIVLTQLSYAQGPGPSWTSSTFITLSPVTPAADFQVKVTLTSYTNIKPDGSDLRFYDNANNNCEYWIETWNNPGTSTIWVKVPTSGTSTLIMYYGNPAASAASNGANTFDFFDDFLGSSLSANWQQTATNSTVTVSGGNVTIACNSSVSGSGASITSGFTPAPGGSFILEAKHNEPAYNRNRFYAGTAAFAQNPFGFDNGYFTNGGTGSGFVFWNGTFQLSTLAANTDYISQWQITDGAGNPYTWNTYTYPAMGLIQSNTNANVATNVRFITIGVTEVNNTSTKVDWVRVRKLTASEPVAFVGAFGATFRSSGTFVAPAGVTSVTVQAWGAGGGGSSRTTTGRGGAGGGGAYASSVISVTPGNSYPVTVGTGGGPSTNGGSSNFNTNSVIAVGGNGAANNSTGAGGGGNAAASTGTTTFSGGDGGGGGGTNSGGGGGGAGSTGAGGIASGSQPGNGTSLFGGNGGVGVAGSSNGNNGASYGGGGGGSTNAGSSRAGGSGANGQVIITWGCPAITVSPAKSDLNCFQDGSGQIIISASGGTAPYSFSIHNGGATYQSSATFGGLSAGTYQIRVRDAMGCESKSVQ